MGILLTIVINYPIVERLNPFNSMVNAQTEATF
jgi:hypothetical protein